MPWYRFQPTGTPPYNIGNLAFYGPPQAIPPSCISQKKYLCAIQADDTGGQPILTFALGIEIATAINSGIDSTNVKLRNTATI
nr:hypothetical protein [uncultured Sphingobacterium sp.]